MRLVGKYDGSSAELEGDVDALQHLSAVIKSLTEDATLDFHIPKCSPSPYTGFISRLRIAVSHDNVIVSRVDDVLFINGSYDKLSILADNIKTLSGAMWFATPHASKHIHIEYHVNHFYLDRRSLPL